MQISAAVSEALALQRLISAELLKPKTMQEKLNKILKAFVDSTKVDSALLYATAGENYLELIGEWKAQNYKSNIRYNEDAIGRSAATKRIIRETNEAQNITLLSIPVTRLNLTIGALVLVKNNTEAFNDAEIETAETLALALPDLFSDNEFAEFRNRIIREKGIVVRDALHGTSLNKGFGVGKAVLHHRHRELVNIFANNIELEKSKLAEGRQRMVEYFDSKIEQA